MNSAIAESLLNNEQSQATSATSTSAAPVPAPVPASNALNSSAGATSSVASSASGGISRTVMFQSEEEAKYIQELLKESRKRKREMLPINTKIMTAVEEMISTNYVLVNPFDKVRDYVKNMTYHAMMVFNEEVDDLVETRMEEYKSSVEKAIAFLVAASTSDAHEAVKLFPVSDSAVDSKFKKEFQKLHAAKKQKMPNNHMSAPANGSKPKYAFQRKLGPKNKAE